MSVFGLGRNYPEHGGAIQKLTIQSTPDTSGLENRDELECFRGRQKLARLAPSLMV